MTEQRYQDWIVVQEYGTDFEADILRDRLDDAGIPAVVLSQRDHAHSLNVGTISSVKVMVPEDSIEEARRLVADIEPVSDEELTRAALSASNPELDEESGREDEDGE